MVGLESDVPGRMDARVSCDTSGVRQMSDCSCCEATRPLTPLATSATLLGMRDIFFSFASASAGVSFVALGGERS